MTSTLYRSHDEVDFWYRLQLAELDYLTTSRASATTLAEDYVGLPVESACDILMPITPLIACEGEQGAAIALAALLRKVRWWPRRGTITP